MTDGVSQPGANSGTSVTDRLIHVTYLVPTLPRGGAERQLMFLAGGLPTSRFRLQFLTLAEAGELAPEAESLGVPVHQLGLVRDGVRKLSPGSLTGTAHAICAYRRLTRSAHIVDAWLVPAYTFAGVLQPLTRVPVLLAGRRSSLDVPRTRSWYREAAGAFAMRQVDGVVANSQSAAEEAIEKEGINPSRVHVIRNAVVSVVVGDEERSRIRQAWDFSPADLVVGCVGNLQPGKGHDLLLDVASDLRSQYPDVRWCFVGDGPLRAHLSARIEDIGLAGTVVIHTYEPDARRLYDSFDIAVQASESEGLPNVVLEAAAAGRPIVATAVGGTGEIVSSGEDGILVPKDDRGAMEEAIRRLLDDAGLRRRLGAAARHRAEAFSVERLVDRTASLYERLVEERQRKGRFGR